MKGDKQTLIVGRSRHDALETAQFFIDLDGQRVACWITNKALERLGASGDTPVASLVLNMDKITRVATAVARRTPKGERIVIRSEDFEEPIPGRGRVA
jgi:hypothetical protein